MEKILRRLSFFLALMCLHSRAGHSELIVYPRDIEVLVNHSTYFNCSTSIRNEQIHWYHYHVGENRTNIVYYKGELNKNYPKRYSVMINNETGEYNLIIHSVQSGDAGRYVCQDDGGRGRLSSAELIVLETNPICASNMRPEGLVGPNSCGFPVEELHLSCNVLYIGNIPPILQWKMEGEDTPISNGITIDYSGRSVTMNLTMSSEVRIDGVRFTCGTTRSHHKQHNCATGPVKINYAVGEPMILTITKGESVTCSANASAPCQYRWFYGNNTLGAASCNNVIMTTHSKDYSCEASCPMKGFSCTFIAMRIFVIESETSKDTTKTLLLAILIPTVVFFAIATYVLFCIARRAKVRNKKLAVENAVMRETMMQSRPKVYRTTDELNGENTQRNEETSEEEAIEMEHFLPVYRTTDELNGENSQRNEETSEEEAIEMAHFLPDNTELNHSWIKDGEIITKASRIMGRAIAGVAILDELIYVVSDKSSDVETFALETFEFNTCYSLAELEDPWDLTSCKLNKCLYIMDRRSSLKPKCVIRVDSGVSSLGSWSTGDEYGNLSVTSDGRVVVTVCESRKLFMISYGSAGTGMNVVSLSNDFSHPSHAIELSDGQFLISHGFNKDSVHRVSIIKASGELVKNSSERMETPSYLAVSESGLIFVADQGNSRVCTLNSGLELIEEVVSKKFGLRGQQRICLDERTRKLFVIDNEDLGYKRRYGKLFIFRYDFDQNKY